MRFTVRKGSDPVAVADRTLLHLLKVPPGGLVRVGDTHVAITAGAVPEPNAILLGDQARANAGLDVGQVTDVKRAVLAAAQSVQLRDAGLDETTLARALQGRPVTNGDRISVPPGYADGAGPITVEVVDVSPDGAAVIGAGTSFPGAGTAPPARRQPRVSTSAALVAGLENELDLLTGWFSLLATERNLEEAWGLPAIAGILVEGPLGCGKSELIEAAAARAGAAVVSIDPSLLFKPESLLEKLSDALDGASAPTVLFVDRLETLTGDAAQSSSRTQFVAILRWFLEAVADKRGVACALGVQRAADLDPSLAASPLLPRRVTVPPPDLARRRLLFEAGLARVPREGPVDYDRLAARTSGFSAADILAAVAEASASVARTGEPASTEDVLAAVEHITPSLGGVPLGEVTGVGFDQVADLVDVKQRLTEAVIWPLSDPERFARLGVDPPRGILLWGPPGTGKTFVVKALAHEAGAAFFSVKGAELLDKYVGESEKAVRDVFDRARAAEPSMIFFDEFDALAPIRGRSTSSVGDQVVAALLTEIDGVTERGRIAVIAATNRRDLIDPALLRPGRFETHIHLDLPAQEARRALLDVTDVRLAADVDLEELAARTEGMSFADVTGLLREGAMAALRSDDAAHAVGWHHLEPLL